MMTAAMTLAAVIAMSGTGSWEPASGPEPEWGRWRLARYVPWYGAGLYGNRMACGHRLRWRTRGVAHRTLPCGTRIELRKAGRSVIVRVKDRGPFPTTIPRWMMPLDLTAQTMRDLLGTRKPRSIRDVRWRIDRG